MRFKTPPSGETTAQKLMQPMSRKQIEKKHNAVGGTVQGGRNDTNQGDRVEIVQGSRDETVQGGREETVQR